MLLKSAQIANVFHSSSYFSFINLKKFLKVNHNCHKPNLMKILPFWFSPFSTSSFSIQPLEMSILENSFLSLSPSNPITVTVPQG